MMMQQEFLRNLAEGCALLPGSHVLVAVSGGADSVALLCLFASVRDFFPLSLSCAHVEHGIRGEESMTDCAFVRTLCETKNIPFYTCSVDAPGYAKANGCGLEEAARTLRYDFLERTADAVGADVIALAHHALDQAETVLMHAARGSDMNGLCAMRLRRGRLIRPLLSVHPDRLRAYLDAIGQLWREDATNADTAYTRNRIRHTVMPALERAVPGAEKALCRLARAAQRDEDFFVQQLNALDMPVCSLVNGVAMEKARLTLLHPALLSRQLVRTIALAGIVPQSADVIERIMQSLETDDAVVNLTGGAHAVCGKTYLSLILPERADIDIPLLVPGETETPFGRVIVRRALAGETGDGKREQVIPARLLEGACVTGRREGDMMIPFGMHAPVKLKKLMIDAGIERAMRASVPVLRRGDTVLFAAGLRPAECVRSTEDEERMMVCFMGFLPGADERQKHSGGKRHD